MHLYRSTRRQIGQIGQVVGKEPTLHPIHAQVKSIRTGRRRNRIGAGLLLPLGVLGHGGEKLPRYEGKALQLVDDEVEVVALGDFGDAHLAFETRSINPTFQGNDSL